MNWFDTSGLTSLAKTALKEAQKTIDKALDIQDDSAEEQEDDHPPQSSANTLSGSGSTSQKDNSDFFSSWGLTVSMESSKEDIIKEQPVVTESPSKSTSQSVWGSFAGSFFELPKESIIVRPPKAKSMNVIADANYDNHDDLFSRSQLVMSDATEGLEFKNIKSKDESAKVDERRGSSRSARLSLVSSRNSSDSVEVLSQSLKTTPDSEGASGPSMSHSSSAGQKLNSESVEILPDSLVSPSSIECLGFDSYSSDKNSSTSSSNVSPADLSDKKSTPVGERTEKPDTADSISLVADDDEDTMSYNSISECTAPTVLDTDEKVISPYPKTFRSERKIIDKELVHLEQCILPPKMQMSENSSNDGSWSDRTLNADSDSGNLDVAIEEPKKECEPEDILIEKLSDSSSFYDVNLSRDMMQSESSAFVNIEKQHCNTTDSSASSQKDCSVKERTSPVSSDSKSDLVKIGSDRTSGHTSGDEVETATSSDIEIIPSPNGDNGHGFCRNSPAKYGFKNSKFDGTTSPSLVDLVLGKSLATKIRGHNRELSEASVQSNTSDESQGSENDRLMRRLCEMAEILEARENRLMEVSRNNAELAESNADLKNQVESLQARHCSGDINMITEDYTQRMSALEKKFQQAIREKDQLRKQLDTLKAESSSRKNSSEFENVIKEKDDIISQLHEEGEKLARQQLQHSNIIKKLRAKEKDNEQVIKSLRDKVAEQTSDMERLKRSIAAKEELEVNQIEAVYRLTTANKKLEQELAESQSALEDSRRRAESGRAALEAARRELAALRRGAEDAAAGRAALDALRGDAAAARRLADTRGEELARLRQEVLHEERRWASREEALRREVREARELCAAASLGERAGGGGGGADEAAAALLQQLAALQCAALQRDQRSARAAQQLQQARDEAEALALKAQEREKVSREECGALRAQLERAADEARQLAAARDEMTQQLDHARQRIADTERQLDSVKMELEAFKSEKEARVADLERRLEEGEREMENLRQRLPPSQPQEATRGDVSPQSASSDSFSATNWLAEEGAAPSLSPALGLGLGLGSLGLGAGLGLGSGLGVGGGGEVGAEEAVAALTRRDGSLRALTAQLEAAHRARRALQARLLDYQSLQEQYDALLQMYGEKEEQLSELRLDLHDVTQLYKAQLDELVALRQPR